MELFDKIENLTKQLEIAVRELRKTGTAKAEKERLYKIEINKKALALKEEGMPVTLIQTVIYGYDTIAKLRFERDVADAVYNANLECINSIKLQLRLLEGQLSREWGQAK